MVNPKSVSTTTSSQKRKRSTPAYYVVKEGWKPGVYMNYADVQEQVKGYPNAFQRKFNTLAEAEAYYEADEEPASKKPANGKTKYYAIRGGPGPGIYSTWDEAKQFIHGHKGIKHHSFNTFEEAQNFLNGDVEATSTTASLDPSTAPSVKGEFDADIRNGCKVGDNSKRQKLNNSWPTLTNDDFEAGDGPLPLDAEDGFDPTIAFSPVNGKIVYKNEAQLSARKLQPTGDISGPLVIYTDGSTLGNGRVGAVGGVGVYFGPQDPRNVSEALPALPRATNQRAELTAIKRAVELAPIDKDVLIISDSNYAIKCVTEWFQRWERNNWKTAAGKVVENKDLVEPVLARIREREIAGGRTNFQWVKGHASDPGNVCADSLAVNGSREASKNPDLQ